MKKPFRLTVVAAFAALILVAAACGSSDEQPSPTAPTVGAEEPSPLPPTPEPGGTCLENAPDCEDIPGEEPRVPLGDDDPSTIGGTCLKDAPDCDDIPGEEPTDLPLGDPSVGGGSGGFLVNGGLTVSEALATDATGIIAVKGFLVVDDSGARLCELLAESFPAQCGGSSIPISGYEEVLSAPLNNSQGVSWTDDLVSFLGEIVDGTLVVDPLVAQ